MKYWWELYMYTFSGFAIFDFFPRLVDYNLEDQFQLSTLLESIAIHHWQNLIWRFSHTSTNLLKKLLCQYFMPNGISTSWSLAIHTCPFCDDQDINYVTRSGKIQHISDSIKIKALLYLASKMSDLLVCKVVITNWTVVLFPFLSRSAFNCAIAI